MSPCKGSCRACTPWPWLWTRPRGLPLARATAPWPLHVGQVSRHFQCSIRTHSLWLSPLPAAVDVAASLSSLDCMNKYLFHSLEKTMTLVPALFSPADDCIVLDDRSECRYSRAVDLSSWYCCESWMEGLVRALTVSDGDNSPGQNWTVGAHRLLRLHGSRLQAQFSAIAIACPASSRPAQWMLVHECQPSECPCKWARPCMPMPLRQPSECTCKHASPVHALANMPAQCMHLQTCQPSALTCCFVCLVLNKENPQKQKR